MTTSIEPDERQIVALSLAFVITVEIVRWKDRRKDVGKMSRDQIGLLLHAVRSVEIELASAIRLGDLEQLCRSKAKYEQIAIDWGWSREQAETTVDGAIGQIMQVIDEWPGRNLDRMTPRRLVPSEPALFPIRSTMQVGWNRLWEREKPYDFFLSYASADSGPALTLYHLLWQRCRVFLAGASLEPGKLWLDELVSALDHSRIMVVLVSSHTDQAYFQTEEILRMIARARADTTKSIVPIFLDSGESSNLQIPFGLAAWQGIWLSKVNGIEDASEKLLGMLSSAHP